MKHPCVRYNVALFMALSLVSYSVPTINAAAQEATAKYNFNLPAGDAGPALQMLGSQSNSQIAFSPDQVANVRTQSVVGQFTLQDALSRILKGTKLSYRTTDSGTIIVSTLPPRSENTPLPRTTPTTTPSSTAGDAKNDGLEEVVVTARRRAEKLQSVPIAITALSGADIRDKSITSAQDLNQFVPSLLVSATQDRNIASFTIRGQGQTFGAGPGVVSYMADVPIPALYQPNGAQPGSGGPGIYFDLDSIQVLKGPQGTLFGRNTTGGAVLFEPKKPTRDFEGYFQETLGDYNWREEEGAINVPVIEDKLLIRFAANVSERDGFTKNITNGRDLDNQDYWSERLGVTFRPTDDFENYLLIDSLYSDSNGTGTSLTAINPDFVFSKLSLGAAGNFLVTLGSGPSVAGLSSGHAGATIAAAIAAGRKFSLYPQINAIFATQAAGGPRQTSDNADTIFKSWVYGITDTARWDISDDLTLKNIASYHETKFASGEDQDGSSLPLVDTGTPFGWSGNYAFYTEELQFQGHADQGFVNWIAGSYLEFDHPIGAGETQGVVLGGAPVTKTGYETQRSQAVYAQGTYDLSQISDALEGFKLTGGYRYTWDFRSDYSYQYTASTGACSSKAGFKVPNCALAGDANFAAGTWTVDLDYQITPKILAYVTARTGYKSGGFNISSQSTDPAFRFQPEHVQDVEIGTKSDWDIAGVPLRTNADLFHLDYSNIQRTVPTLSSTGVVGSSTENAASATIEGFEFEGTVVPIEHLDVSVAYSYLHASYNKYLTPTGLDFSDLPFPFAPKNKYSVTARYHLPVESSVGDVSVAATYSWEGSEYGATDREPLGYIGSYGLLNLKVDWDDMFGRGIDSSFFMTNATDQVYRISVYSTYNSLGYNQTFYGEPRMWGFQLRYRFGPNGNR